MKLARYCACGGALTGRAEPDSHAKALSDVFDATHNEPGCAPATADQALAARRRNELAWRRSLTETTAVDRG